MSDDSDPPIMPPVGAETGAVIDIGTNSIKLLVAAMGPDSDSDVQGTRRLDERVVITRLGEGMQAQSQRLREAPMRRTLDALDKMVDIAHHYGAHRIVAVGTAALRDAANRDEFLRRAHDRCNLHIDVIEGQEEARLSFLAVRRDPLWRSCERLLVIDIGGGSTEIIQGIPFGDEIGARESLNLGAVRLTENYLKSDPPTITQLSAANQAASAGFHSLSIEPGDGAFTAVGVGGTITSLATMDLAESDNTDVLHGHGLTVDRLEREIERLATSTVAQHCEITGLDPQRADIILGGAILLSQALACIGSSKIFVSTRGLRWGVLYDRFPQ